MAFLDKIYAELDAANADLGDAIENVRLEKWP
jgi:hypothetical protein